MNWAKQFENNRGFYGFITGAMIGYVLTELLFTDVSLTDFKYLQLSVSFFGAIIGYYISSHSGPSSKEVEG